MRHRRQHPDDRVRAVVHLEHLPDDRSIPAKPRLPVRVSQDQHGVRSSRVVRLDERTANERLDPEDVEEIGRDDAGCDAIGLATPQQIEVHLMELDEAVEARQLLAIIVKLLDGHADVLLVGERRRMSNQHETIAVVVWQRLEQDAIEHAEDRGVRANPETEREHGEHGEPAVLQERLDPVADVSAELLDPLGAARLSNVFFMSAHLSKAPGTRYLAAAAAASTCCMTRTVSAGSF